ncbi:MAG TPA: ABC transporter permease, partial [Thermoanaerobaculia bacterium]|nr:ABC transporter permease [Thermoanaerobaculia bacterium]
MERLWKDIRFSIRSLRSNPGFALVAILTLALGIGATTAIFSVVNGVLLRPLPLADPDRLVMVYEQELAAGVDRNPTSPINLKEWLKETKVFSSMGAYLDWEISITGQANPELVVGSYSTSGLFPTLGAKPFLGRVIGAGDYGEVEQGSVVLSHAFWQRKFGGDPKAVGRVIQIDGQPYAIAGVMQPEFFVPGSKADVWIPYDLPDARGRYLRVIARLAPGVSVEQANAHMKVVMARLGQLMPEYNAGNTATVFPAYEQVVGDIRLALLIVLSAVSCLLLIACVNIANLLLSRATVRAKEMAIRGALGASRGHLIRQLLTESLVLATVAGLLGVLIAGWATMLLLRFTPESAMLPRTAEIGLDYRVLGVAAALTLLTGVFFGVVPAIEASRVDLQTGLKSSGRGSSQDRRRKMFRNVLVVVEIALATVLLVGAGLMIKSFAKLQGIDTGVERDGVLTMRIVLPDAYRNLERRRNLITQILGEVRAIPGVRNAGATIGMPFTGYLNGEGFKFAGDPDPRPGESLVIETRAIAGDYFRAMGIPILRGRVHTGRDIGEGPAEVVVNEAFVERYGKGGEVIGRRIEYEWFQDINAEIVGIAGNVRSRGLDQDDAPAIYHSYVYDPNTQFTLVIGATGDPRSLQTPVTRVLQKIAPSMPVDNVQTLDELIASAISRPRFNATLLTMFAVLGLLLASMGVYGVLSYTVTQRTQEMGIRIALGADPAHVRGL